MKYFHAGKLLGVLDDISKSIAVFHVAFEVAYARFKDVFETCPF